MHTTRMSDTQVLKRPMLIWATSVGTIKKHQYNINLYSNDEQHGIIV